MNRSFVYITPSVFIIALSVNAIAGTQGNPYLAGLPFEELQQQIDYLELEVGNGQQQDTILQDNIEDEEAARIEADEVLQEQINTISRGSCPCWDANLLYVIHSFMVQPIPFDTEFKCSEHTTGVVSHGALDTSKNRWHYQLSTDTRLSVIVPSTGEPSVPTGDPAVIFPPSCRRDLQPADSVEQIFYPPFLKSTSDVMLEDITTQEARVCSEILMSSELWALCD